MLSPCICSAWKIIPVIKARSPWHSRCPSGTFLPLFFAFLRTSLPAARIPGLFHVAFFRFPCIGHGSFSWAVLKLRQAIRRRGERGSYSRHRARVICIFPPFCISARDYRVKSVCVFVFLVFISSFLSFCLFCFSISVLPETRYVLVGYIRLQFGRRVSYSIFYLY